MIKSKDIKDNPPAMLLIVDPQRRYVRGASSEQAVQKIRQTIEQLRAEHRNIIICVVGWFEVPVKHLVTGDLRKIENALKYHIIKDDQLPQETEDDQFHPDILAVRHLIDFFATKKDADAFTNPRLLRMVSQVNIQHLYVGGFEFYGCVFETAASAILSAKIKRSVLTDLTAPRSHREISLRAQVREYKERRVSLTTTGTSLLALPTRGLRRHKARAPDGSQPA